MECTRLVSSDMGMAMLIGEDAPPDLDTELQIVYVFCRLHGNVCNNSF